MSLRDIYSNQLVDFTCKCCGKRNILHVYYNTAAYGSSGYGCPQCKGLKPDEQKEDSKMSGKRYTIVITEEVENKIPVASQPARMPSDMTKEVEVYRQTTENMDLVSVIKAINGIKP